MARKSNDDKYEYVLDYIDEAITGREGLVSLITGTTNMYKGIPTQNRYLRTLSSYGATLTGEKRRKYDDYCKSIVPKNSMVVFNAVETLVSLAMGGVGQFQFLPQDKYLDKDPDLLDDLASLAESFHSNNKIDVVVAQAIRQAALQGAAYLYLDPSMNKVSIIDAYSMLIDPISAKTNKKRFIGYTQRESWSDIRDKLFKSPNGYLLKSVNEVDTYITSIKDVINSGVVPDDLRTSVDMFYQVQLDTYKSRRKANPEDKYIGDDIECAYIWDYENDMYFQVVNRKYIITAKKNPLSGSVKSSYYDSKGKEKEVSIPVKVESPFVELPFIYTGWETYPITPLFYLQEDFNTLCTIETIYDQNLAVMAPLNFIGSSYDAEQMSLASNVVGEFIEGTTNQSGVFNKQHDLSPTIAAKNMYEEKIKRAMGAIDQYEMQGMIGNRATAAEVASTSGVVSQRLNQLIANIEAAMGELTDKLFKYYLIFNTDDTISFTHNGKYKEVSKEDMAGDMIIKAKLRSSIKIEQAAQARNALMLFQSLIASEFVDKAKLATTLIPLISQDTISHKQAADLILPQYKKDPSMEFAAGTEYDPVQRAVEQMTPEQMAMVEQQLSSQMQQGQQMQAIPQGQDNYQAGVDANAPVSMAGAY